jgi:hypothetical protein
MPSAGGDPSVQAHRESNPDREQGRHRPGELATNMMTAAVGTQEIGYEESTKARAAAR